MSKYTTAGIQENVNSFEPQYLVIWTSVVSESYNSEVIVLKKINKRN